MNFDLPAEVKVPPAWFARNQAGRLRSFLPKLEDRLERNLWQLEGRQEFCLPGFPEVLYSIGTCAY
jgi:hypothetical protein